jgi:predicted RNase H-like HicB family nuclease
VKLTIDLERAADTTEETWVSHCLELDAISQGRTPQEAIEAIAEAVDMMVRDEIAGLESSGQIENPGWERAVLNIADEVARRDAAPAFGQSAAGDPHASGDHVSAEQVRAVVRDAVLSEGRAHPGRDVWYPSEHAAAVADRVAAQLVQDPLHARVVELAAGLRPAGDHIDALHLPDPGLRAEERRLLTLAGKP